MDGVLYVEIASLEGTEKGPRLTRQAQLLLQANQIRLLEAPSNHEFRSLEGFFHKHTPLLDYEYFLEDQLDLVNLEPGAESAWLDHIILFVLVKIRCRPIRVRPCVRRRQRHALEADPGAVAVFHACRYLGSTTLGCCTL